MTYAQTMALLDSTRLRELFAELYGTGDAVYARHRKRYADLIAAFRSRFGETASGSEELVPGAPPCSDVRLFSSPGRSEIGGNHTDHNLGKVLAASIQLDCIGAVSPSSDNAITIHDITYNEDFSIDTNHTERVTGEKGSIALVRGIAEGFKRFGYRVGGFNGCFSSEVIAAAGVSSSASFEMMICIILNNLYNNGSIPVEQFARIGQFAENAYWDKASGLLDQMACAVGGLIAIDFCDPAKPAVERIPFDFAAEKYKLIIVNTGKSHADLSREYSSIPEEMRAVAHIFGQENLRGLTLDRLVENLPAVRAECGDRAVLRAFHFLEENQRVDGEVAALKRGDFPGFLALIAESGSSSWRLLQNTHIAAHHTEQSIPVCLALSEVFIREQCQGRSSLELGSSELRSCGVCRVHGGGFAGVIQVFLPEDLVPGYTEWMERAMGVQAGSVSPVYVMSIRPRGVVEIR
ncbi:MAG: galactokinase [Spirochaetaceae bacterium]|nr:galactokinase [Spirochaetaceae bacterium]